SCQQRLGGEGGKALPRLLALRYRAGAVGVLDDAVVASDSPEVDDAVAVIHELPPRRRPRAAAGLARLSGRKPANWPRRLSFPLRSACGWPAASDLPARGGPP